MMSIPYINRTNNLLDQWKIMSRTMLDPQKCLINLPETSARDQRRHLKRPEVINTCNDANIAQIRDQQPLFQKPKPNSQPIFDANPTMSTAPESSPPSNWVHPTLTLPPPTLDLDFRISCALNPIIRVGSGPWGQRNWISFTGGQWTAKWGRGTIEVRQHPLPTNAMQ